MPLQWLDFKPPRAHLEYLSGASVVPFRSSWDSPHSLWIQYCCVIKGSEKEVGIQTIPMHSALETRPLCTNTFVIGCSRRRGRETPQLAMLPVQC